MNENMTKEHSDILIYQAEDGKTHIDVRLENKTVWVTQAGMSELFQTTPQNITMHIKAIYVEGELIEESTCKEYLQVRDEGYSTWIMLKTRQRVISRCLCAIGWKN